MSENSTDLLAQSEAALFRLHAWLQNNGWAGFDPYDLQHLRQQVPTLLRETPVVRWPVSLLFRLAEQFPARSRSVLIPRRIYPKAMGLFAESYAVMHELYGGGAYLTLARECADWLLRNPSAGYSGLGWGLPIDWQGKTFYPQGTPFPIVSAICGHGFWRLYRLTGDPIYMDACRRICEGFVHQLQIDRFGDDRLCFSYSPLDNYHVHNVNLTIAAFLIQVGQSIREESWVQLGHKAANYSLAAQTADGGLPYQDLEQVHREHRDNIHSGFEVRAFHALWKLTGRPVYEQAFRRYFGYYISHYYGEDGAPWRNPGDSRVVDVHGCAEALLLYSQVANDEQRAVVPLRKSVQWILDHMQSPKGYFIYRSINQGNGLEPCDVPFIRWGQAWMMRGLTAAIRRGRESHGF